MEYGLIGEKLVHSFSPKIHKALANYNYSLCPLSKDAVAEFLRTKNFKGINVTIPYKQTVIEHLDELSNEAKRIGAVNTVKNKNGKLIGYNTDYFGFKYMLESVEMEVRDQVVAVLGTGGASKAVKAVLEDLGAKEIVFISRSGECNYDYLHNRKDVNIIVNSTPVGTYPNVEDCLVDLRVFSNLKGVADLVYNPSITELIYRAKQLGIKCVNGLSMLVAQAKKSAEIFLEKDIDDTVIKGITSSIERQTKNLVLVGMPGVGKTTIGKLIATKTGREFIDSDIAFTEKFNKTPATYILENGEKAFRDSEEEVLKGLLKESGRVIATGGGAVIRDINVKRMKSNSTVVWLKGDIAKLSTTDRPLSSSVEKLAEMLKVRTPMYENASEYSFDVQDDPMPLAEEIIKELSL